MKSLYKLIIPQMISPNKYYTIIFVFVFAFIGVSIYTQDTNLENTIGTITDKGVPVLAYHQIVSDKWAAQRNNPYVLGVGNFKKQIQWLKEEGYTTITLKTLNEFIAGEKAVYPEKPVVITFDDGTKGFTRYANDILKNAGFKAALFIFPNAMGKDKNYLNWAELEKIKKEGHEIEAHGYTHPLLTRMSLKQQLEEFKKAKSAIKNKLGVDAKWMAYPFGVYNEHTVKALEDTGYTGAFTVYEGDNRQGQNSFFLNRYLVLHGQTMQTFSKKIRQKSLLAKVVSLPPGSRIHKGSEIKIKIPSGLIKENLRVEMGRSFIRKNKKRIFSYDIKTGIISFKAGEKNGKYLTVTTLVTGENQETRRASFLYLW
ncbi:MAG: polysaccharide deacetylase family protein [Leptospirales bacterium]